MDATVTPLTSTREAPFLIQSDDTPNSSSRLGHKQQGSTTVVGSDSAGRSVRSDSNQSMQKLPKSKWSAGLGRCGRCRGGNITSALVVVCCPWLPAAKVHGMLGSSFEFGVIYFGSLVFGMVITLGLSFSNQNATAESSTASSAARSSGGYVRGDNDVVAQEADPTAVDPVASTTSSSSSSHSYIYLTLALLALFMIGIGFLRTKARHRFNIPGNRALDCLVSTVCCWCVLAQTQRHIEKNNRYEFGLDTPSPRDTLPAYSEDPHEPVFILDTPPSRETVPGYKADQTEL